MYLLLTVAAALVVGLVLVVLVQVTFGTPEPVDGPVGPDVSAVDGPRFPVVRRGYDPATVDRYLDDLAAAGTQGTDSTDSADSVYGAHSAHSAHGAYGACAGEERA